MEVAVLGRENKVSGFQASTTKQMRTALFCVNNPKQSGSQEIFSPS
jgi:hypothetical protein